MRICYLANARSIHTQRWVKYFADKGHEMYLISLSPWDDNSIENVNIYVLKRFHPQIRIVSFVINLLFAIIQVRDLVKKIKPDVLHAHYVTTYGFLGALTRFHPLILSAWGDIQVDPEKSSLWRNTIRYALKRADIILSTSQYLATYAQTEFKVPAHRTMVIPWGIDLNFFHKGYQVEAEKLKASLGINDSHFVILSPRALRGFYRIENIVKAIPYVIARHPNVVFIVLKAHATDSKYEAKIDNLIRELGVSQNIRLIRKMVRPEEMPVLNNISDVSISIPESDQFAACIMEAMACGVIPIVGDLEVYKQYLVDGKNAFFVNPEDPKDIAQKIIYCIEHPELKERFYEINRKIIEENEDWDKNAPKMEELYDSLIGVSAKVVKRKQD